MAELKQVVFLLLAVVATALHGDGPTLDALMATITYRDACRQVSDNPPPLPDGWPHAGRIWPAARLAAHVKREGWPHEYVTLSLPQREHSGVRAGQQTGSADQPVLVVPVTWMRALAAMLGRPIAELCRGKIEDDA